jgi:hypothetical protein
MLFAMEPTLPTDPDLQSILADLSSLEPIFHWPVSAMSRAELEKMTVDDFWETGASGRRYSRQFVLDVLEQHRDSPQAVVWETRDFHCRRLAEDVYLLTYTLLQNNTRLTRRSTIWQKTSDCWKIVYHQGTVVQDT